MPAGEDEVRVRQATAVRLRNPREASKIRGHASASSRCCCAISLSVSPSTTLCRGMRAVALYRRPAPLRAGSAPSPAWVSTLEGSNELLEGGFVDDRDAVGTRLGCLTAERIGVGCDEHFGALGESGGLKAGGAGACLPD